MEATNVDPEFVLGWKYDYFGPPECEVQRVTEVYTADFVDYLVKEIWFSKDRKK